MKRGMIELANKILVLKARGGMEKLEAQAAGS
jgi:hypothetical protein